MLQPSTSSLSSKTEKALASGIARGIGVANQWRLLTVSLIINDIMMIGLAFMLAYVLRFSVNLSIFRVDVFFSYSYYQTLSLLLIPIWIVIFAVSGLYNRNKLLGGTEEYSLVFRSTSVGMFVLIIFSFLYSDFILSRGWLILAWIFSFLLVSIGRFIIRRIAYAMRRHSYFLTPALIIGANREGRALAEQLIRWHTSGLHIIGFVDDKVKPGSKIYGPLNCLGGFNQLEYLIREYRIGEIILSNSALSQSDMMRVFKKYGLKNGVNLHISSGLFEIITTGLDVREFAYVPLVRVRKVRLAGIDRALKLILDYSVALLALIFILPLLCVIGLIVRLDSPGPVIFRRKVMGLNGRQFDAIKFRTMYANGDEILANHPDLQQILNQDYKLKNDPRITRVGQFLRKTSLDELPQLFNVLLRDMSLVGPRIITPEEMTKYGEWGMNLLTVRPGITGLWQVSGRSDLAYDERVRLDMHYIRNWSIWSDLHILWRTIPVVVMGRGAY